MREKMAATTGRTVFRPFSAWRGVYAAGQCMGGVGPLGRPIQPSIQSHPADVAATIYHCLGVDPAIELRDNLNRPMPICLGRPIFPVIG